MNTSLRTLAKPEASVNKPSTEFFPALDELRFFAAFAVIVHHVEQFKCIEKFPSLWGCFFISCLGKEGVRLFLVLSGFLITRLLLKELNQAKTIQIFRFYGRRALRIWPLYFLVVLVSFFLLPTLVEHAPNLVDLQQIALRTSDKFADKLLLFSCFLPNLCMVMHGMVLGASQCWSLGLEEQYYVLFPILLIIFRRIPIIAIAMIGSVKFIGLYALTEVGRRYPWTDTFTIIHNFLDNLDFESFAIGGMAAYLMVNSPSVVQKIATQKLLLPVLLVIVAGCSFDFHLRPMLMNLAFAALISILAINPSKDSSANLVFRFLGRISYGLYMYQGFVITGIIILISNVFPRTIDATVLNVFVYPLVITVLIAISALSYHYLEKPFLARKSVLH